jgi:hypothetical protein
MHIYRLLLPLLGAALIALPALAQPRQPTEGLQAAQTQAAG